MMNPTDLAAIQGIALGIEGSLRASGVPRVMISADEARQLLAAARLAQELTAQLAELYPYNGAPPPTEQLREVIEQSLQFPGAYSAGLALETKLAELTALLGDDPVGKAKALIDSEPATVATKVLQLASGGDTDEALDVLIACFHDAMNGPEPFPSVLANVMRGLLDGGASLDVLVGALSFSYASKRLWSAELAGERARICERVRDLAPERAARILSRLGNEDSGPENAIHQMLGLPLVPERAELESLRAALAEKDKRLELAEDGWKKQTEYASRFLANWRESGLCHAQIVGGGYHCGIDELPSFHTWVPKEDIERVTCVGCYRALAPDVGWNAALDHILAQSFVNDLEGKTAEWIAEEIRGLRKT